jgi:hypothetical protein
VPSARASAYSKPRRFLAAASYCGSRTGRELVGLKSQNLSPTKSSRTVLICQSGSSRWGLRFVRAWIKIGPEIRPHDLTTTCRLLSDMRIQAPMLIALVSATLVLTVVTEYVSIENGTCESHGHMNVDRSDCELMAARSPELLCGSNLPRLRLSATAARLEEIRLYRNATTIKNNPVFFAYAAAVYYSFFSEAVKRCDSSNTTAIETQLCFTNRTSPHVIACPSTNWAYQKNLFWEGDVDSASTGTKPHGCMAYLRDSAGGGLMWVSGFGGEASSKQRQVCSRSFGKSVLCLPAGLFTSFLFHRFCQSCNNNDHD